jgi:hypothetical protein
VNTSRTRAWALSLTVGACLQNPDAPGDVPALDSALFAREVAPVLERRCASLACHGSERRRLRVYAIGSLRRDARRQHLVEPLTDDERAANETSARAFAAGVFAAHESLLVTKATARVYHQGGAVFERTDDPECDALLRWLRSGGLP